MTSDLLDTNVSDRITWYSRLLTGCGKLVFFIKLCLMEFQVGYLALFCLFSLMNGFWVVLNGKRLQDYLVNAGVPQGSIFGPVFFLQYIDDVVCYIAIYAEDTTLYFKLYQTSDLWQQLELPSNLESDLPNITDLCIKCLVDFIVGKTQLVPYDRSNNSGAIDKKNYILRCCDSLFLLNRIGALIFSLLLNLQPRELESWLILWSIFLRRFLFISINLPYGLA